MTDQTEAFAFLDAILGDAPTDLWAALWTRQTKDSVWCPLADGVQAIADRAIKLSEAADVYVTVSVAMKPGSVKSRITADTAAGIAGMWADFDYNDGTSGMHKKLSYPPNEAAVLKFLDELGVPPTLIVHSGNGLHVWWLFNEFWSFDNESERSQAAKLARDWYKTIAFKAAQNSYVFDATWDLSRLLRVPGTWNRKGETPLPVRLDKRDGPRYNPEDFEKFLIDDKLIADSGVTSKNEYEMPEPPLLSRDANISADLFNLVTDVEPGFKHAYEHTTKGKLDTSLSSWDLMLANYGVKFGWSNQQVADLLIMHRRKWGDIEKAMDSRYIARTISKAHDWDAKEKSPERMIDALDSFTKASSDHEYEDQRAAKRKVLDAVGDQFGLHLTGLIKYTSEPPTYRLQSPTGEVDLGSIEGLTNQEKARNAILAGNGVNYWIGRYNRETWDDIVKALISVRDEQDVGVESTSKGRAQSWLAEFFDAYPPVDTAAEGFEARHPFMHADGVGFTLDDLRDWLWLEHRERLSQPKLGPMLRQAGCFPSKVNLKAETPGGKRPQKSIWLITTEALARVRGEDPPVAALPREAPVGARMAS